MPVLQLLIILENSLSYCKFVSKHYCLIDSFYYHKINNWCVDGNGDLRYYYRQINIFAGD